MEHPIKKIKVRKRMRLPDFDYSQDGAYFITIVTQNRVCLFGEVIQDVMVLNDSGKMLRRICQELPQIIQGITLNPFQIMPNHFHAIIFLENPVGATLRGRPGQAQRPDPTERRISLPDVIGRFKSITTNHYIDGVNQFGWTHFNKHLWQRSYYEHVIRDERDHQAIVDYILTNPQNWIKDQEYSSL